MRGSANSLRQIASLTMDHDQVPNEVRSCLDLLRICNKDLQRLIEVRDEHISILRQQTAALERVNNIIEAAHRELTDVYQLIGKCRPGLYEGSRPNFRNRMRWLFVDSMEFRNREPVISRHHAAVLAELNFVRQCALLKGAIRKSSSATSSIIETQPSPLFENMALLGDLMGDLSVSSNSSTDSHPRVTTDVTSQQIINSNPGEPHATTELSATRSPLPRHELPDSAGTNRAPTRNVAWNCSTSTLLPHQFDDEKEVVSGFKHDGKKVVENKIRFEDKQAVKSKQQSSHGIEVARTRPPEASGSGRVVLNSADNIGLSLLLGGDLDIPSYSSRPPQTQAFASVSQLSLLSDATNQQDPSVSSRSSGYPYLSSSVSSQSLGSSNMLDDASTTPQYLTRANFASTSTLSSSTMQGQSLQPPTYHSGNSSRSIPGPAPLSAPSTSDIVSPHNSWYHPHHRVSQISIAEITESSTGGGQLSTIPQELIYNPK